LNDSCVLALFNKFLKPVDQISFVRYTTENLPKKSSFYSIKTVLNVTASANDTASILVIVCFDVSILAETSSGFY
jgi:hypothetical protein